MSPRQPSRVDATPRLRARSPPAMSGVASEFWRNKYEREARKYWDVFYRSHGANFFKDRHWLAREWPDVFGATFVSRDDESARADDRRRADVAVGPAPRYVADESRARCFLEVGCGVGNTVFPLLELDARATVYCCDFSARAIDMLKARASELPEKDRARVKAFVCDATCEALVENVPRGSIDAATLVFALSAMSREKMSYCLRNLSTVMRDGQRGTICVRDYAAGDLAQERLEDKSSRNQKLSDNFYVRSDGTRAYYFSVEDLVSLFADEGLELQQVHVQETVVTNRAESMDMNRRWIQAQFASARQAPEGDFVPPPPEEAPKRWSPTVNTNAL